MTLDLLLFSVLREAVGADHVSVEVADDTDVARIASEFLAGRGIEAASLPPLRFAVNEEFVPGDHVPRDGDRLAVLSPFSGG